MSEFKLDLSKLDRAFNPETIVVIGDRPDGLWLKWNEGFPGTMYSVQVNPETGKAIEESGIRNFRSVAEVPGKIDLVIVSAPRVASLQILDDCIKKDVGAVHFFTAGFSETDTEEGQELERKIEEKAKTANLHLIGPNCMGIYNAKIGIGQNMWKFRGPVAPVGMISQSGTHASTFGQQAHLGGMDVDKEVSFGNGIVLDSWHYLRYFDEDPAIKVIAMYLEGVKDGRKFLEVLKDVAGRKPVVIWKGGRTEEGDRAIASHTGSLAVSREVWQAALRQCGAAQVSSMEELVDTVKAFLYMPPVTGSRVGITGGSGGQSVAIADVFGEAGLEVPRLEPESVEELASFCTLIGGGYLNPIDTGNANRAQLQRILEVLEKAPNIDNIVLQSGPQWVTRETPRADFEMMGNIRKNGSKPVMVIVPYSSADSYKMALKDIRTFQEYGVPAFTSIERAARALRNAYDYYRRRVR